MDRSRLELAAYLGDRDAAGLLRLERMPAERITFEQWAWGFPRFGQAIATRAGLGVARSWTSIASMISTKVCRAS
jgi:hypothetical protein